MKKTFGAAFIAVLAASAAHAHTIVVGDCVAGSNHLPSIGAAIDAVGQRGTVKICPGLYAEQLSIGKSVSLVGIGDGANAVGPVIVPPGGGLQQNATSLSSGLGIAAQIWIHDGATVNISNVTVDAAGNGIAGCAPVLVGILYQNASGKLSGNVVRNDYLSPFDSLGGCQSGDAVFVQSDGSGGVSQVTAQDNVVEGYQKNGITGNEVGTNLIVTGNTVLGMGPTAGAAENAIQIGFGAAGAVTGNTLGDSIYADPEVAGAAGVLVYDSAGVSVQKNIINSTQYGVAVYGDGTTSADNAVVNSNMIGGTHAYDAIDICGASNATIKSNTINGSDESAIHLDSECGTPSTGNVVSGNKINGACAAILEGDGSGGSLGTNTILNVLSLVQAGDVCPASTNSRHGGRRVHLAKPQR